MDGVETALIGEAGREVIGGTTGVAAELLVVGRDGGFRDVLERVEPDPEGSRP